MARPKRFVYVLNSESNPARYYTGITSNVRARLTAHNAGRCTHSSRWTPWRVIVVVAFAREERAMDFERYLKSGSGATSNSNPIERRVAAFDEAAHSVALPLFSLELVDVVCETVHETHRPA